MAYIRRETPACAAIPDASTVTLEKISTPHWKVLPATYSMISGCDASGSLKREISGKYSCRKYDAPIKINPPISAVRKIAFGITRSASLVSSDREEIPSKPRNEKHRMVAPVIIGTTCAPSDQNGRVLVSVPAPSPWD